MCEAGEACADRPGPPMGFEETEGNFESSRPPDRSEMTSQLQVQELPRMPKPPHDTGKPLRRQMI